MKRGGFGKLDHDCVMSGALRPVSQKPAVLCTWLAYVAHRGKDGTAFVGQERISKAFGISEEAIRKARRVLECERLLVDTGRRVGRCKVYLVAPIPQHPLGSDSTQHPNTWAAHTPTGVHPHPNTNAAHTPTPVGTNRSKQKGTESEQAHTIEKLVMASKRNQSP